MLVSLLCTFVTSCSSNDDSTDDFKNNALIGCWISRPYQNSDGGNITMQINSNGTGTYKEEYEKEGWDTWSWNFKWKYLNYNNSEQFVISTEEDGDISEIFYEITEFTETKLVLVNYGIVETLEYEFHKR